MFQKGNLMVGERVTTKKGEYVGTVKEVLSKPIGEDWKYRVTWDHYLTGQNPPASFGFYSEKELVRWSLGKSLWTSAIKMVMSAEEVVSKKVMQFMANHPSYKTKIERLSMWFTKTRRFYSDLWLCVSKVAKYAKESLFKRMKRFMTNLPFRMAIGKFGIWMMKAGRYLQVRYANWNGTFRMEVEFHPNHNMATFHVSEQVTDDYILTFESPKWQAKKKTPMVDKLFSIKGVSKITLQALEIGIEKGQVFTWEELRPKIEEVILTELTKKQEQLV